jgi:uncharacterized protein YjbI with pentapeptide repeats
MKTIKPQKLGILTRVLEHGQEHHLVVTVLAYFPFDAPESLLLEADMWKAATAELGPETPLDAAVPKPRGEILLAAKGYPVGKVARPACSVRVKLGPIDKTLWIVGDRVWRRGAASDPVPFTEMPIRWENAFGGPGFAQNPLGKGFAPAGEIHPLPNVEDPKHLVGSPRDRPAPAGFGAYDMMWPQRHEKIGTYDEKWLKERFPGFAADFDPSFFNTAPADQQLPGYFAGDEAFSLENMHPDKPLLESRLPRLKARVFVNQKAEGGLALREVGTRVDTVVLIPHLEKGIVIFRGTIPVAEEDAADVAHLVAGFEDPADPRPTSHYETVLGQRLDRKKGHLYVLRDGDLLPAGQATRPEERSDMKALLAQEGLLRQNMRRRAEAEQEVAREKLRAQGIDPTPHVPALPPEPPPVDLDNISAVVEQMEEQLEAKKREAAKQIAEAEEKARAICAENGVDYEKAAAEQKKKAGGPPRFSADKELEKLRDQQKLAENAGVPLPHVNAALSDPALEAKLRRAEEGLREAYRVAAHHFPPAAPREPDERARLREEVRAAREAGQSFAGRDLTGADLSGLDLANADLRTAWLEGANLAGTDLRGADLSGAVVARADLSGADLGGAKLRGANLGAAKLAGAKLAGADLTGAVLAKADLTGASFAGARLVGADLAEATFADTDFSGVTAAGIHFLKSDLRGLKLAGASLTKCNFLDTKVEGVDFSGATLTQTVFLTASGEGAIFKDAKLTNLRVVKDSSFERASFAGAEMSRANLRGTRLSGSDFSGARLDEADLSECDLRGATLRRAVARDSRFIKADLSGADASAADLMRAILQRAKIAGASFRGANLFRADLLRVQVDGATDMKGANLTQIRYVEAKRAHGPG